MRAIFLDFDGVTHPVSAIADWRDLNIHTADMSTLIPQRGLFRWLPVLESALIDAPDVDIVVHSAWRSVLNNTELKRVLGDLAPRFIGITPLHEPRYVGIESFAQRCDLDHYIVIDDATQDFPLSYPYLLPTDPELGLSAPDVCAKLARWLGHSHPKDLAKAEKPANQPRLTTRA